MGLRRFVEGVSQCFSGQRGPGRSSPAGRRLQLEGLEDRFLLTATALAPLLPPPPGRAVVQPVQPSAPMVIIQHTLSGTGSGTYSTSRIMMLETGQGYGLQGVADLNRLGQVTITGNIHGAGLIASGHAGGTLTFSNDQGSVTIMLRGPSQPGFAHLPSQFNYRVVSATGNFQGLTDQGSLQLRLVPGPVEFPLAGGVVRGSFTLSI